MKALSIRQPWAWLIANRHKDIENRTWRTKFRGTIFIHAGKKIDVKAYKKMVKKYNLPLLEDLETGGIIGRSEITGCVETSDSAWFSGPFGFELKDSKPLPFIPCRGQLSFFTPTIPKLSYKFLF